MRIGRGKLKNNGKEETSVEGIRGERNMLKGRNEGRRGKNVRRTM